MPAKRSIEDALTVLLAVEAMHERSTGNVLKRVFPTIAARVKPFKFQRRGGTPVIDKDQGAVLGDRLTEFHVIHLCKKAKKILRSNELLRAHFEGRLVELRRMLATRPGSYVVPIRPRGEAKETPCQIALWWPSATPEETLTVCVPFAAATISVTSSENPDGPYE